MNPVAREEVEAMLIDAVASAYCLGLGDSEAYNVLTTTLEETGVFEEYTVKEYLDGSGSYIRSFTFEPDFVDTLEFYINPYEEIVSYLTTIPNKVETNNRKTDLSFFRVSFDSAIHQEPKWDELSAYLYQEALDAIKHQMSQAVALGY